MNNCDWYGLSKDGKQLRMSGAEMGEWAMKHDKTIQIGWSDHYEFDEKEVESPLLKGARFVRASRHERFSDVARRIGWNDLAQALEAHSWL